MAESNAEIVRRWQATMSAGSRRGSEAVEAFWDSDSDYYPVRKFPDVRPRHGRSDVIEFIKEFWDAYAIVEYEVRRRD